MAVNALQLADQLTDGLGTGRRLNASQLLSSQRKSHGMHMRADAANTFHQVKVLNIIAVFSTFFHSAVHKAQTGSGVGDDLAVHGEFKMTGLFQRGMLRADRNDKFFGFVIRFHLSHLSGFFLFG
ncbi:hypothetical protein SDC9_112241 [bioreactor metagenome]|uniref:Uncharacterized protein n=1 Tax=bioreactor metagenome TaxID=1076179 RepID=A0A645BJG2_9ZZZZ